MKEKCEKNKQTNKAGKVQGGRTKTKVKGWELNGFVVLLS